MTSTLKLLLIEAQWAAVQPDVVVLDLSLPGRGTVGDRIVGLNLGER